MSTSPAWDPAQYLRFADERLRPAPDLIARIPHPAPRADGTVLLPFRRLFIRARV